MTYPIPRTGRPLKCLVCGLDKPWGIFSTVTGEAVCADCRDKARSSDAPELRVREFLWLIHGHDGLYGDDGEMQCSICRADYKRDPLEQLIEKARTAIQAFVAEYRQRAERAETQRDEWIGRSSEWQHKAMDAEDQVGVWKAAMKKEGLIKHIAELEAHLAEAVRLLGFIKDNYGNWPECELRIAEFEATIPADSLTRVRAMEKALRALRDGVLAYFPQFDCEVTKEPTNALQLGMKMARAALEEKEP